MSKTTEHRDRVRRVIEKIDRLDAENVARFERLLDGLATRKPHQAARPGRSRP